MAPTKEQNLFDIRSSQQWFLETVSDGPHRLIIALLGDFGSESFLMSDVIGQYL